MLCCGCHVLGSQRRAGEGRPSPVVTQGAGSLFRTSSGLAAVSSRQKHHVPSSTLTDTRLSPLPGVGPSARETGAPTPRFFSVNLMIPETKSQPPGPWGPSEVSPQLCDDHAALGATLATHCPAICFFQPQLLPWASVFIVGAHGEVGGADGPGWGWGRLGADGVWGCTKGEQGS